MNSDVFFGFSNDLDSLSDENKSRIEELIFFYENNNFSVITVFNTVDPVENLINFSLPDKIIPPHSDGFGLDLSTIKTDMIKVYIYWPNNEGIAVCLYYLNRNGDVYQKEVYKDNGDVGVLIDRYDGDGNIISENEAIIACTIESWKGPDPTEIIDSAQSHGYTSIFMRKLDKDHYYLRISK
jgi:hypothetical protein